MSRYHQSNDHHDDGGGGGGWGGMPGKRSMTQGMAARPAGGEPLPAALRERFESKAGDLSDVRVHTGGESAERSAELGARAFTVGNDVHFGAGQYQPDDPFGIHLIAHEVAHTQQQRGGETRVQCKQDGAPADGAEADADAFADEVAPVSTRDPAVIGDAQTKVLRKDLELERDDNRSITLSMARAIEALDEQIETATGDQLTELQTKRADFAAKQKAADAKLNQAVADLKVLERGPDVTPTQVNDMLARRQVNAHVASADGEVATTTKVDAAKASGTRTTTTTSNALTEDGASRTDVDSSATTVSLTGASKTTGTSSTEVKGETTTKNASSTTTSIDWSKGSVSASESESTETTTGGKTNGTSSKSSVSVGMTGASASQSETKTVDNNKTTNESARAINRNNGELSVTDTRSRSTENEDGSTSKVAVSTTAGVVDTKDGRGVMGGADASGAKRTASGLECSGAVKVGGRAVVNVRKIDGADPAAYEVAITITFSGSASGSAGAGSKADAANGGKFSVGASGSMAVVASFGQKMSEEETKAWLAGVETGSGKGPGMDIIATGLGEGWDAARALWESRGGSSGRSTDTLADGESTSLDVTTEGGVNGSAGGNAGPASVGIEGGISTSHQVRGSSRRDGDKTITSFLIKDGDKWTAGGSAGYGVASYGISASQGSSQGTGYVFTVFDKTPNAAGLRGQLDAITTQKALDDFAKAHPELVGSKTTTAGEDESVTNKVGVGPAEISVTNTRSFDESHTEEFDENGKVKSTTDAFTGTSGIGGNVKVGPLSGGSNHLESVETKVKTVKNEKGEDVQVASGDAQNIDTSNTPGLNTDALEDPLALVTGKKSLIKQDEKKEVAGVFLGDGDFNTIMAMARDPGKWNRACQRPANLDDWEKCRKAILAAKGDKVQVAEALSRFGGGGEHGRSDMIADVIGAHEGGGGVRYDFPDGMGDLKAQFGAIVLNDPIPGLDEKAAKDPAAAAADATKLADQCDSMLTKINCNSDKFEKHDQRNDMVKRLSDRSAALRRKALELGAKASGKEINPELLDKVGAAHEWNAQLEYCKQCAADEQKYFNQMSASDDVVDKVKWHNELKNLHKRWKPAYAKLVELNTMWDFGLPGWKSLKPAEQRLANADPGRYDRGLPVIDPNSDEAIEAQSDHDRNERDANERSKEYAKSLSETMTATAGMTRRADGSYYRELTPEEQKKQQAELAVEVRGRVNEQYDTWVSTIESVRATAAASKGKCNKLTSGGSWDGVVPAAQRAYSEGYKLFNDGEKAWKAAQAAAKAPGTGVLQFFPQVQAAKSAFQTCADKFKAGDQAQG
jgi:hypothetical protein